MTSASIQLVLVGLGAKDSLLVEGIVSRESGSTPVTISHRDSDAGIDPTGVGLVLAIMFLGTGLAAYVANVIFAVRRELAPFCVVDLRGGEVKITVDGRNRAMSGKTLIVSNEDDHVQIDENRGLSEIASALKMPELDA